jgi:uracil-DNA glycosylase
MPAKAPPAASTKRRERAQDSSLALPGLDRSATTNRRSSVAPRRPRAAGGAIELPERPSLSALRESARACRACPLWERATQTVFGEGRRAAAIVLVGEQPGDAEDLAGRPFVGPAGQLLDEALVAAGIDRQRVYVTNAVKHFKWEPRGKRRIHAKPNAREVAACTPWLAAELRLIRPAVVVALGATAAQALLGKGFRVTRQRGIPLRAELADCVVATIHPSAVLRAPDEESRRRETRSLIADLRVAAGLAEREADRA